ncbi:MAG: carboxypeptidase-like regulatory domain-containing protein, partial [Candidatus Jordarchaeaceae archaeon]
MHKRKKAIILASLFLISVFLTVTIIPQTQPTPIIPILPGTLTTHTPSIGVKADPNSEDYPYWWNTDYKYRREIIFNNTASPYAIVNRPVDIFMTFDSGKCHHGSVRVQYWNSTSKTWSPGGNGIPYQIWNSTNSTNYYISFTITFYINLSAYSSASYFIYYNDSYSGAPPSFTSEVSYTNPSTGVWNFYGQNYWAVINNSTNGGKIYLCYNNVSGSWSSWAYDNAFHWSPQYKIDVVYRKANKYTYDTWVYDSSGSGHAAESTIISETGGPIFIMFSTRTKLTLTSGGDAITNEAGYANVTYRFFKWGWITETQTTITYNFTFGVWEDLGPSGRKRMLELGRYVGNNYKFDPQLTTLTYKYGVKTTVDPFTGEESLGEPYWLSLYSTSTGQLAGVTDLMVPTLDGVENRNWGYTVKGTSYTPEEWQRAWAANLTIGNYVNEKYAFYVGGSLSSFETFADGISFLGTEGTPLRITIVDEEYIHYTVYIHVTDYDGAELNNANVTVYSGSTYVGSKVTNSSGYARFYLEPGDYNFNATWNGATIYETYTNSTTGTVNMEPTIIPLVFYNITTLVCRTQYSSGNPIQNAYVRINKTSGEFVDQSNVNLTGYAVFHINRSSWFGNYIIEAFWLNGTKIPSSESYPSENIDSATYLTFTVTISAGQKYTYLLANATSVEPRWGTDVYLKIYWRDSDGYNLSTNDPGVGGYVNWTLNFINGTNVYGPISLTPQGSGGDIYYLLT